MAKKGRESKTERKLAIIKSCNLFYKDCNC